MKTVNFAENIWVQNSDVLAQSIIKHDLKASDVYGIIANISIGIGSGVDVAASGFGSNGERIVIESFSTFLDTGVTYSELQDAIADMIALQGVDRIRIDLHLSA